MTCHLLNAKTARHWLACLLCALMLTMTARAETRWAITTDCAPPAAPTPEDSRAFDGVIALRQPGQGVRLVRADVPTPYFAIFEGASFTSGAALSPDGRWLAVPHGYILTVAAWDVRYRVNELRVFSTERVPRLRRVIPWDAGFQRTLSDTVEPVRWLDDETLLYPKGNVDAPRTYYTLNPFAQTIRETVSEAGGLALAADGTQGVGRVAGGLALLDAATGQVIRPLDDAQAVDWRPGTPDLMTLTRAGDRSHLILHSPADAGGALVFSAPPGQVIRDFAWSPDGARFAFSLYDPQDDFNRLYLGEVATRTLRDPCIRLAPPVVSSNLAWSPDSAALALNVSEGSGARLQVYDSVRGVRFSLAGSSGGIIGWGLGDAVGQ